MRWSVVLLAVLGVVAALSAAVLVGMLKGRGSGLAGADATALVANANLPAMTVISDDMILPSPVGRDELPPGSLLNKVQIVGQLLVVPMKQGQPFTKFCFAGKTPGQQLLRVLPPGQRAMAVSLANYAALSGLLYPGAVVDVLATFRAGGRDDGTIVSKTLMQGVRVLAIEDETVGGDRSDKDKAEAGGGRAGRERGRQVTLMVNTQQAKSLQMAMEHGSVSLVLRNPSDVGVEQEEGVTKPSDGQVAKAEPDGARPMGLTDEDADQEPLVVPGNWEMQILRGSESSVVNMPWPSGATPPGQESVKEAPSVGSTGGS